MNMNLPAHAAKGPEMPVKLAIYCIVTERGDRRMWDVVEAKKRSSRPYSAIIWKIRSHQTPLPRRDNTIGSDDYKTAWHPRIGHVNVLLLIVRRSRVVEAMMFRKT